MAASPRGSHAAKITVYLTPDELHRLERMVMHMRHDLGLKVDRGRVVREALVLARADLAKGAKQSALVKRYTSEGA